MEAVKLRSATIGLKNKEYAVLIALKRASSDLSSYQKNIIPIDDHLGISIAGITADTRVLSRYMCQECLKYKYSHDDHYPVGRLIANIGNKMQDRRPYGVGLVVAGYDDQGPHIYQSCPFDCKAMPVGSRSQSARTYLEKHSAQFPDCTREELIRHGVQALQDALPNEVELNNKNITIAIVGEDENFHILEENENAQYLANIVRRGGGRRATAQTSSSGGQPSSDDDESQPETIRRIQPKLSR